MMNQSTVTDKEFRSHSSPVCLSFVSTSCISPESCGRNMKCAFKNLLFTALLDCQPIKHQEGKASLKLSFQTI